jgi:hypothetical protein
MGGRTASVAPRRAEVHITDALELVEQVPRRQRARQAGAERPRASSDFRLRARRGQTRPLNPNAQSAANTSHVTVCSKHDLLEGLRSFPTDKYRSRDRCFPGCRDQCWTHPEIEQFKAIIWRRDSRELESVDAAVQIREESPCGKQA